jgi:hypothetical protein
MCTNLVSYYVPRGFDYREVKIPCGRTDVYGDIAICEQCAADPRAAAESDRRRRLSAEINAEARASGLGEF